MTTDATSDLIDLRETIGPAGDQGRRGTCVAFAVTALHAAAAGGLRVSLSEEYLFWGAKQRDGRAGDGTTYEAAAQALGDDGQCLSELWPYDDTQSHQVAGYGPPSGAASDAKNRRATCAEVGTDVSEVRALLDAGAPVAIGIPIWADFETTDGAGVVALPAGFGQLPLEHAVAIVGHDPGRGAVLVRNSWGTAWGDDGHAWIDESILAYSGLARAWSVQPPVTT